MNVLIAQEESQAICKEFRALGHNAFSCDLLPCSGGHPEWHYPYDVRDVLDRKRPNGTPYWDLVIAHPVCRYMSNSGSAHLYTGKGPDKVLNSSRWASLADAIDDFNLYTDWHKQTGVPLAVENPQPHKHAKNGFPDHPRGIGEKSQIIHPWQFGHPEQKKTYLWLFDLPNLTETNNVHAHMMTLPNKERQRNHWIGNRKDRAKLRSKTYPGIAKAMASQWSDYLILQ